MFTLTSTKHHGTDSVLSQENKHLPNFLRFFLVLIIKLVCDVFLMGLWISCKQIEYDLTIYIRNRSIYPGTRHALQEFYSHPHWTFKIRLKVTLLQPHWAVANTELGSIVPFCLLSDECRVVLYYVEDFCTNQTSPEIKFLFTLDGFFIYLCGIFCLLAISFVHPAGVLSSAKIPFSFFPIHNPWPHALGTFSFRTIFLSTHSFSVCCDWVRYWLELSLGYDRHSVCTEHFISNNRKTLFISWITFCLMIDLSAKVYFQSHNIPAVRNVNIFRRKTK